MNKSQTLLKLCEEVSLSPQETTGTHAGRSAAAGFGVGGLLSHAAGHRSLGYAFGAGAGLISAHVSAKHAVRQFTRNKYDLHNHIDQYQTARKQVTNHPDLSPGQKRREKKVLYHSTMANMVHHIASKNGGNYHTAERSAHRAMHGNYLGTRFA